MPSAVPTTPHAWHIARWAQQRARGFKGAAPDHHGHQARRDDCPITHPLLRSLDLAEGVQEVGTQTIEGDDLILHGNFVFQGEVRRLPSPGRTSPMDVNRSQLGLYLILRLRWARLDNLTYLAARSASRGDTR